MTTHRPTFLKSLLALVSASAAALVLLTTAGAAQAATFTGQTARDLPVRLETGTVDGVPRKLLVSWRTGACKRPGNSFSSRTRFEGFEVATTDRLATNGKYVVKQRRDNLRSIVRVRVSGERVSDTRWTGKFSAKVRVKRNGKAYERCRQPQISWNAQLTPTKRSAPAIGAAVAEGLRN